MDSNDLSAEQLEQIQAVIGSALGYLGKLKKRMDKTGFLPSDPLQITAEKAYDAIYRLSVTLHYMACDVRRRERDARDGPGHKTWG